MEIPQCLLCSAQLSPLIYTCHIHGSIVYVLSSRWCLSINYSNQIRSSQCPDVYLQPPQARWWHGGLENQLEFLFHPTASSQYTAIMKAGSSQSLILTILFAESARRNYDLSTLGKLPPYRWKLLDKLAFNEGNYNPV